MKKPISKIRDEITKLTALLKQAEAHEAERIGYIALKAGLGEIEVSDSELQKAFEDISNRFSNGDVGQRGAFVKSSGRSNTAGTGATSTLQAGMLSSGGAQT